MPDPNAAPTPLWGLLWSAFSPLVKTALAGGGLVASVKWVIPWAFRQLGDYVYRDERKANAETRAAVEEIRASQTRTEQTVTDLAERFDAHAEKVGDALTLMAKEVGVLQGAERARIAQQVGEFDRRSKT